MIYLDNAATTKINEMALKDLIEKSKFCFGNPSTSYSIGVQAKKIINEARNKISSLLHCDSKDLFFTSGGTEANNIIIQSFLRNAKSKSHIICSSIEHESILNVVKNVKNNNVKVTFVNPDKNGIILPESIEKYIDETNTLVCVQLINNEVGSLQPIKEIAKIVHKHNAHIHVDAVQAIGHIAVDIKELDVDSLSASAHKFAGPKGVGFLYTKQHEVGLCFGGGQEKNVKIGRAHV